MLIIILLLCTYQEPAEQFLATGTAQPSARALKCIRHIQHKTYVAFQRQDFPIAVHLMMTKRAYLEVLILLAAPV